jgi:two-component system phosphate regulon response regulator PhoB
MAATVLVVEDEPAIQELIAYNLKQAGHQPLRADSAEQALRLVQDALPDLVLLDWMLPGLSGIELARRLRSDKRTKAVPIIMLTARAEEQDKLTGLDTGADDYITKPFSPAELVARMRAVLRRTQPALSGETLEFDGVSIDLAAHRVRRGPRDVHLGPTEFRLLRHLLQHPGRVFSREQLLDAVWGRDVYVEPRTVDVHIRRLRKALNEGGEPDLIRTVRSAGYSLDQPVG